VLPASAAAQSWQHHSQGCHLPHKRTVCQRFLFTHECHNHLLEVGDPVQGTCLQNNVSIMNSLSICFSCWLQRTCRSAHYVIAATLLVSGCHLLLRSPGLLHPVHTSCWHIQTAAAHRCPCMRPKVAARTRRCSNQPQASLSIKHCSHNISPVTANATTTGCMNTAGTSPCLQGKAPCFLLTD